jgi:hypothetical protein
MEQGAGERRVRSQRSDTVLRRSGCDCRHMRDARWHHRGLTAKLRDCKCGAVNVERVDQGFFELFFLRAHEKGISGFECFRISRDCFHSFRL